MYQQGVLERQSILQQEILLCYLLKEFRAMFPHFALGEET